MIALGLRSQKYLLSGSVQKSVPTSDINNSDIKFKPLDIYRILHPAIGECTLFSRTHRTFTKREHILPPKKENLKNNKKARFSTVKLNYIFIF